MSEAAYTVEEIVEWSGGRLVRGNAATALTGTSIDTRTLAPSRLFVAIRGPNHDAHRFLPEACARGAAALLVECGRYESVADALPPEVALIEVDDTTAALGRTALGRRRAFPGPVVAITGSSGKTTTKELCAAILSVEAPCLKTAGNLNNEFGLPLTLLSLRPEHRTAVVELGMNHRGEIARLAAIAEPDVALVTNAGVAHIEFLGSRDAIAQEKGDLFAGLRPSGTAVANADDERVLAQSARAPGAVLRFARDHEADVRAEKVRFVEPGSFAFELIAPGAQRASVEVAGLAETTVINALAAAAAALAAGATLDAVAKGLARYAPPAGRMNPVTLPGGIVVLDDTYNANPLSMAAALDTLQARHGAGQAIAVLGDMGELGTTAEAAHRECGEHAAHSGVDLLLAIGDHAARVVAGARTAGLAEERSGVCADAAEAAARVRRFAKPGDWVLVKGSRSMKMERVIEALRSNATEAMPGPAGASEAD